MTTPYLKWTDSQGRVRVHPIEADQVLLGRTGSADVIFDSRLVSRTHAKLIKEAGGCVIQDLNSLRGTYVNGRRVDHTTLTPGDKIGLGQKGIEVWYHTEATDSAQAPFLAGLEDSLGRVASLISDDSSDDSELETVSAALDYQYQWNKEFSAERTFEVILRSALKVSGAERGFILLRSQQRFEYMAGLNQEGRRLPRADFRASFSVAQKVADEGKPAYMTGGIDKAFIQSDSIVALHLHSLACLPLRWLMPESRTLEVRGVLYLDSTGVMGSLSKSKEKVLGKLASGAADVFEKLETLKAVEERRAVELELTLSHEKEKGLHRELEVAEERRETSIQVLLAEHGKTVARLAAALSHEINNPLAALSSSLQTLETFPAKRSELPPEKREELTGVEARLFQTARRSAERVREIVGRMERLANSGRSEVRPVDLNTVLKDAIDMLDSEVRRDVSIELETSPTPQISVRPRQINAALLDVLQNAVETAGVDGCIRVSVKQIKSDLEVVIADDGKQLSSSDLSGIFDPSFRVQDGRITAGWSLFGSRQIMRDNGGDIQIESGPGQGTTIRVRISSAPKKSGAV